MNTRKGGLGRGFDSLIPTQLVESEFDVQAAVDESGRRVAGETVQQLPPSIIDPNPHQPRQDFKAVELGELADSIRVHGIMQPLIVTVIGPRYELIAGERRLRAAKLAGLETVPAIVRSYDEQQKLELALLENLQRADLNLIETATAYRKLIDQFNLTGEALAQRLGRSRPAVANTMRLLGLPVEAKRALIEGKISEGLARVLLTIDDQARQAELLQLMQTHGWTVRQAEEFARGLRGPGGSRERAEARITQTNELTQAMSHYLSTKVTQVATAKGGRLVIEYTSEADLARLAKLLGGQ